MARTEKASPSDPPELPEIRRQLKFGGWQIVGLGLIATIPVLAAFETFGEGSATVSHLRPTLAVFVEYPPRMRHGTSEDVTVQVTNRSRAPLGTVAVRFDSSYVARFSHPQFLPSAADAYEIKLTEVRPGETRTVRLGMHGSDYGRHRGRIVAFHEADTARVTISTIVFP